MSKKQCLSVLCGTVCVRDSGAAHQQLPDPLIQSFLHLELAIGDVIS